MCKKPSIWLGWRKKQESYQQILYGGEINGLYSVYFSWGSLLVRNLISWLDQGRKCETKRCYERDAKLALQMKGLCI